MKLWGGRFEATTDSQTDDFHSSVSFDKRLYKQDIKGSMAHAKMLAKQGIITADDAVKITEGLSEILESIESGDFQWDLAAEDVHMNIEAALIAKIGDAGKRLHTGRSRNDQVALDMRMYLKEEIQEIMALLKSLNEVLVGVAKDHTSTVMPGYTHLQRAQPITFSHHLAAYVEMFKRDINRFSDCLGRTDVMPLGSGALAATSYPLDRPFVAAELGFSAITANSLDGVSDRDFCLEFLSDASILMTHLSRFCEEIILWSSFEFRFIELSDAYSTGSSIMPQKKNPDMAELIRGKTGRVYGSLMGLLTTMKGLPMAYNKDMQEDKEGVFDAIDTVKLCLSVFTGMVATMKVKSDQMRNAAKGGFINATDAADWLVGKGIPFREAHDIIGKLVLYCITHKTDLESLSLDEYKSISPHFDESVFDAIDLDTCVEVRNIPGGPAKSAMEDWIKDNL